MQKIRKSMLTSVIFLFIIIIAIIGIKKIFPKSMAESNETKIKVIFKDGAEAITKNEMTIFDDVAIETPKTVSNTLIIPGKTFSEEIENIKIDKDDKIDCETFYLEKFDTKEEKQKALDEGKLWAYSFTGWHIVGTSEYIPQKTVFQPGDPIIPEVLEAQGIIKINEDDTVTVLKELELEAVWGKCYFVSDNGSNKNKGNDYTKPYNSINIDTKIVNAFSSVIMLTGDVTRRGNIWTQGATIKSMQNIEGEKFCLNSIGTGKCSVSGNIRIDNVINTYNDTSNITKDVLYFSGTVQYWEQTARNTGFLAKFYNSDAEMITVLYGGEIRSGEWFGYETTSAIDRIYYFGRMAKFTDDIKLGISGIKGEHTGKVYLYITGGEFKSYVTLGRESKSQTFSNDKYIYIYGDKSGNSEYDVVLSEIYPSGLIPIDGNIYINIAGCTNIKNVFGGGRDYTATITENVYLNIKDCNIDGNVNAGGKYGSVDGTVSLNIKRSNIKGNIYGSGMGATSISTNMQYLGLGLSAEVANSIVATPPSGFPKYNKDTQEVTMYKISEMSAWSYNGSGTYNTWIKEYIAQLSEAYVGNSNIYIEKSIIGVPENKESGNIFGGGADAHVKGDTSILLKDCVVYGNVYGGGDGVTQPESFKLCEPLNENEYKQPTAEGLEEALQKDNSISSVTQEPDFRNNDNYGEYYTWSNDINVLNMGGIDKVNKLVYSSNMEGWGDVYGSTNINIDGGTIYGNVYGGGNAGKVYGDTIVTISAGTYTNIFGGGDQSYVKGNTDVTIGQENSNANINVTGLVYGGGRGYDADNDGDASDFTTVYGNSKVLIQGVNTSVENYGSTKLGAVAGNVDVSFKNYWSGNSTAKYKTMNGIDRATTVSFENSYVLLENKDVNGKLVGIQSIENLKIPKGSGLKISANGEITGNFEGGGELYLDSLVCLTVGGNITGQTTMVLNPELMESGTQLIRGGIKAPYLKVKGTAPEEIALNSGEPNKYKILQANKETVKETTGEDYIYYYIAEDIMVEDDITVNTNSVAERSYKNPIINTDDQYILNTGIFSTDMSVDYYLTNSAYKSKDYTNITRKLKLISNSNNSKTVELPTGTEVLMLVNNEYYYYIVGASTVSEISLVDFKKSDETTAKYNELKDITNSDLVTKTYNEIKGTTSYSFKENYKFIFSFENTEGIEDDTYYPSIEVYYGEISFGNAKKDVANNIVNIQEREYSAELNKDREYYESNGIINLSGNIIVSEVNTKTVLPTDELNLRLKLQNSNGKEIAIPQGTQIKLNNQEGQIQDGKAIIKWPNSVETESIAENINVTLDMAGVLLQNRLPKDNYTIKLEYQDNKKYKNLAEIQANIIDEQTLYGVSAKVNQMEGIAEDKIQLIEQGQEIRRNIKISATNSSELKNMKLKIKALEKTGEFEYQDTTNSKKISIGITEINMPEQNLEQDINITFGENIQNGIYRIVVELYDEYGTLRTQNCVNFAIIE